MRISANDVICGRGAIEVRQLLRRGGWGVHVNLVKDALEMTEAEAEAFLGELADAGYIAPAPSSGPGWWRPTIKGSALMMASASPPMKRAAAEKMLLEFLARVEQVRDDPAYVHKVTSVVLFGSFMTEVPTLGDLDVALVLRRAFTDPGEQEAAEKKCRRDAERAGRNFPDFVARLFWPEQQVRSFLKSRKRISLHDQRSDGPIIEAGPHVTVYDAEKVVVGSIPLLATWPPAPKAKRR